MQIINILSSPNGHLNRFFQGMETLPELIFALVNVTYSPLEGLLTAFDNKVVMTSFRSKAFPRSQASVKSWGGNSVSRRARRESFGAKLEIPE